MTRHNDNVCAKLCDWCELGLAKHMVNGNEVICDICYDEGVSCERCGATVHQDTLKKGLCEICYDDMH